MPLLRNQSDNQAIVTEYLESHPDFFKENPELLDSLNIPHNLGNNIHSLIEYQVSQLRDQNKLLTEKLKYFQQRHQTVFNLSEVIYNQQETFFTIESIETLYDSFHQFLKKYYGVNYLLLFIFVEKRPYQDYRGLKFKPINSKVQQAFVHLFNRNKPLCDSLQSDYLDALFGKKSNTIGSTVAMPFVSDRPNGLMIAASRQANCFEQGMAINLLNQLKSIFIHRLFQIMWDN